MRPGSASRWAASPSAPSASASPSSTALLNDRGSTQTPTRNAANAAADSTSAITLTTYPRKHQHQPERVRLTPCRP